MSELRIFLFALVVVMVVFLLRRRAGASERDPDADLASSENDAPGSSGAAGSDEGDIEGRFFARAQGRDTCAVARVFAVRDRLLLRSLLDARGIPTYVKNEHLNSILPGVGVQNGYDSMLYAVCEDAEPAREIVRDYVRNLIQSIKPEIDVHAIDYAALLVMVPTSQNQLLPEIIEP